MSSPLDELSEPEHLAAFDTFGASALNAWELEPVALKRIACRGNAVYAVEVREGRRLALRVYCYGYHDRASLQSELTWMQSLAVANVATAGVVRDREGCPGR